jgi:hypothetical protein
MARVFAVRATGLAGEIAPRYLIGDRDGISTTDVRRSPASLGVANVLTAPHSPWQNHLEERLIGSARRELLYHVIVLNERH